MVTIWRDSCDERCYRQLSLILRQWKMKQGPKPLLISVTFDINYRLTALLVPELSGRCFPVDLGNQACSAGRGSLYAASHSEP